MKVRRCEDKTMINADVKVRECEDEKMICVDVKMRRDEKMIYRPPPLEEPVAQTLSGKTHVSNRIYTYDLLKYVYRCYDK